MINHATYSIPKPQPSAGGWDGKNRSILIDLGEGHASRTHATSSEILIGETQISFTTYNCCNFQVITSNRLGFTTSLVPMSLNTLEKLELGRIDTNGYGLYIVCNVKMNGRSVREMMYKNFGIGLRKEQRNEIRKTISSSRLLSKIEQSISEKWYDVFRDNFVGTTSYPQNNCGMLSYNMLFFIPEEVIRRDKMFYEPELDLTIHCGNLEQKIYHPAFGGIDNNELINHVRDYLREEGCHEIITINSKNPRTLYRRVGNRVIVMKSRKWPFYIKDGIIIQTAVLDDNDDIVIVQDDIDFNDVEKLKEFGIFLTKEEARLHNSEIEVNQLKAEITRREFEHKELLQQLKTKEAEIKYKETLETIEDKKQDRGYKLEDREYTQQEREQLRNERLYDQQLKREAQELSYRDQLLEARTKQVIAENRLAEKGIESTSRNLASTAAIITGGAAIVGAAVKIASTASTSSAIAGVTGGLSALGILGTGGSAVAGVASAPVLLGTAAVGAAAIGITKGIGKLFDWLF